MRAATPEAALVVSLVKLTVYAFRSGFLAGNNRGI
jgi:hypothetical protein